MSNLNKLLVKLAGSGEAEVSEESSSMYTDPEFVEKLASAVDFLIEGGKPEVEAVEKTASPDVKDRLRALFANKTETEKTASETVSDSVDGLREALRTKLAAKAKNEPNEAFINSLLSRISDSNAEKVEKAEVPAKETKATNTAEIKTESDEMKDEDVSKAASDRLTLADMLAQATGESSDSADDSTDNSVKTAADQGVSTADFLRNSLFKKISGMEV